MTQQNLDQFRKEMMSKGFEPDLINMVIAEETGKVIKADSQNYQIKPGDTLSGIANRTGSSVEELAAINKIQNPDMIYAGDTLQIKGQEPQTDFAMTQEKAPADRILDTKDFRITQTFGNYNPDIEITKSGKNYGVDFAAQPGDKVYLPPESEWEVVESYGGGGWNNGYGNSIVAKNRLTGETLRFSHLTDNYTKPGQIVKGGNLIGTAGQTGNAHGSHLDLEMIDPSGNYVDVTRSRYGKYLY